MSVVDNGDGTLQVSEEDITTMYELEYAVGIGYEAARMLRLMDPHHLATDLTFPAWADLTQGEKQTWMGPYFGVTPATNFETVLKFVADGVMHYKKHMMAGWNGADPGRVAPAEAAD